MSDIALEVENLESGYGEVQVLWGVSLKARTGKLTTILGANGAGKSTTLRTIVHWLKPWKGHVRLDGKDVTRVSVHGKAQHGLVLVPEGRQLFAEMTVHENLEMGAYPPRTRKNTGKNLERVYALFPRLKERSKQRAGTLSGGEQQMLAVGRGLMQEPTVLMIDELSLGLSPLLAQQLFLTLKTLKEEGMTIVLVEQNVHLALALADYAYVMAEGKVRLEGPAQEVANMNEVRTAYLGL
jgi:branched-chain amino acid transport system ATP-binding protein